jgi:hypothetical protein
MMLEATQLAQGNPPLLQVIQALKELSAKEFFTGALLPHTQRRIQESFQQAGKIPAWARSSRLGKLLQELWSRLPDERNQWTGLWHGHYQNRGPAQSLLVVSSHPWDILTMGQGLEFRTCQALDSDWNSHLPANLQDRGMVVAYLLRLVQGDRGPCSVDELAAELAQAQQNRWAPKRMAARVILRLLRSTRNRRWGIYVDRCYGPQELVPHLLAGVRQVVRLHHLPQWLPEASPLSPTLELGPGEGGLQLFFGSPSLEEAEQLPYLDAPSGGGRCWWNRVSDPRPGWKSHLAGDHPCWSLYRLRLEGWGLELETAGGGGVLSPEEAKQPGRITPITPAIPA